MRVFIIFLSILTITACGHSQSNNSKGSKGIVGGPCEGCEAIYEYGERELQSEVVLPDYDREGQKIKIQGTVYHHDGKTPASDVILYVYHTDQSGQYTAEAGAQGWEKRHGSIRGWMKTGKDGKYAFYTLKPGVYPSRTEPAHIHITVKEPDKNEYYIDAYHFDEDPLLTPSRRRGMSDRGGSGILNLNKKGKVWTAKRDIILGKNIPNY